jgi:hypothetical protein
MKVFTILGPNYFSIMTWPVFTEIAGSGFSLAIGVAAIAKMLLPEVATCQRMAMPNQSFRGVDHPAAMVQPAVTEFSVLTL